MSHLVVMLMLVKIGFRICWLLLKLHHCKNPFETHKRICVTVYIMCHFYLLKTNSCICVCGVNSVYSTRVMDKITDSTECNFSILSAIDPAERMTYPVSSLHPDVLIILLFLLLSCWCASWDRKPSLLILNKSQKCAITHTSACTVAVHYGQYWKVGS